jgi:hypothetical protein
MNCSKFSFSARLDSRLFPQVCISCNVYAMYPSSGIISVVYHYVLCWYQIKHFMWHCLTRPWCAAPLICMYTKVPTILLWSRMDEMDGDGAVSHASLKCMCMELWTCTSGEWMDAFFMGQTYSPIERPVGLSFRSEVIGAQRLRGMEMIAVTSFHSTAACYSNSTWPSWE